MLQYKLNFLNLNFCSVMGKKGIHSLTENHSGLKHHNEVKLFLYQLDTFHSSIVC